MGRTTNYPKTIFEQFDVELCQLEHMVKDLQRRKTYWPIYDKHRLPRLVHGQGFMTDNGQFCIYDEETNSIYCMPAVVIPPSPPTTFTLLLRGPNAPLGNYAANSAFDPTHVYEYRMPNIPGRASFGADQNHWLKDRSGFWRELGGSTYQAWYLINGTYTLINEFTPVAGLQQINGVELPEGDGFRTMGVVLRDSLGEWPEYETGAHPYVAKVPTQVLIYEVLTGSYEVAFEVNLPFGLGDTSPPEFTGPWSKDGQRAKFSSYRIRTPSEMTPDAYGAITFPMDHYIWGVGIGASIFDTADPSGTTGYYVTNFKWTPAYFDYTYYWIRQYVADFTGNGKQELHSSAHGVIYTEITPPSAPSQYRLLDYRVSPNADKIAYLHADGDIDPSAGIIIYNLYVMDLDGLNPQKISPVDFALSTGFPNYLSFDWSPDGTQIAVMRSQSGGGATWIVNVDGGTTEGLPTTFGPGETYLIQDWTGDTGFTQ